MDAGAGNTAPHLGHLIGFPSGIGAPLFRVVWHSGQDSVVADMRFRLCKKEMVEISLLSDHYLRVV
jgi:hypothetical protein